MSIFDRFKDIPIDPEEPDGVDNRPQNGSTIDFTSAPESESASIIGGAEVVGSSAQERRRGCRRVWIWLLLTVIVVGGVAFYLRYYNPYITDARERAFVQRVEKRGIIFKTYEVELVLPRQLTDSTAVYDRNSTSYSVANDSLALLLQREQDNGRLIEITYETFYATLPWRGASCRVITAVSVPAAE